MSKSKKLNSFTLIEILVVITIIVIISAIIFASTSDARKSARDTQRIGNLDNLWKALEFYYDDFMEYPLEPGGDCVSDQNLGILVEKGYIRKIPQDPISGRCYIYITDATGQTFKVMSQLESNENLMKNDGGNQDNFYEKVSINGIKDLVYEGGLGGWPEGCFLGGTIVRMSGNSLKNIEDVEVGDRVLSFNPITKKVENGRVIKVIKNQKEKNQNYYLLINNSLKLSPSQILYLKNNSLIEAKNLKLGDILFSMEKQNKIKIFSIKKIQNKEETYNLKVEPFNNFFIAN